MHIRELEAEVRGELEAPEVWALLTQFADPLRLTPTILGDDLAAFFRERGFKMPGWPDPEGGGRAPKRIA